MGKAHGLPLGDHLGRALDHLPEPAGVIARILGKILVDHMIGQKPHLLMLAGMMEMLEMAEANVRARQPGEDRARLQRLAPHRLAGGDD